MTVCAPGLNSIQVPPAATASTPTTTSASSLGCKATGLDGVATASVTGGIGATGSTAGVTATGGLTTDSSGVGVTTVAAVRATPHCRQNLALGEHSAPQALHASLVTATSSVPAAACVGVPHCLQNLALSDSGCVQW